LCFGRSSLFLKRFCDFWAEIMGIVLRLRDLP
jgi:hypothetical protein